MHEMKAKLKSKSRQIEKLVKMVKEKEQATFFSTTENLPPQKAYLQMSQ